MVVNIGTGGGQSRNPDPFNRRTPPRNNTPGRSGGSSSNNRSRGGGEGNSNGVTVISGTLGSAELDAKAGNTAPGSKATGIRTLQNMGEFIDAKTGQGYSGIQRNPLDRKINTSTGITSLKSVNVGAGANRQSVDFVNYGKSGNALTIAIDKNKKINEKLNTVMIFTDDSGKKVIGVEYGGKSYSADGFKNTFGTKIQYDPKKEEFFFGTVGKTDTKSPSFISSGPAEITEKEQKEVKRFLLSARIEQGKYFDAITNTNVQAYLEKQKNYSYDKIVKNTTSKLDKYSRIAKENAISVLNDSDLKTGKKSIDLTAKALGRISYWTGSTGAYALNMISGLGNLALGLALKPNITSQQIIKNSPAMLKQSVMEIGKTFTGNGTIEDFLGTALTATTIATTAASFARLSKGLSTVKMNKQLKIELPQIKEAIRKSQTLLKKEQSYIQKVFMQNSNKFKTFGQAYQKMNGANAQHTWYSISQGQKSLILQRSVINYKNVRVTNIMVAKSMSEKIFSFLKRYNNGMVKVLETYPNSKKLASYLSKVKATRAYTFVEVRGSRYVTAIDGKGNVKLLQNRMDVVNFLKNAKLGKFSFTGKRIIGGNIDTVMRFGKKSFFGTGQKSVLGFKNDKGLTVLKKLASEAQTEMKKFGFKGGRGKKTPFSKTFGQQEQLQIKMNSQNQVRVSKDVALSKGISNSVTRSQLKNVVKAIEKTISKGDIAIKSGFRGVVGSAGLMFFNRQGKLVSPTVAVRGTSKSVEVTLDKVNSIVKDETRQNMRSGQKSGQKSRTQQLIEQKNIQKAATGSRSGMRLKAEPKFKVRVPIPNLDKKNINLVKAILGNKLAPSYQIYVGSGKNIKRVGGRYTPAEAISKGAFFIDKNKQRTVRIVPTKQKPNDRFKVNYLSQAGRKFRNYRIKRGKRVAYSSTRLIEKRKFFNDFEKLGRKRKK